MKVKEKLRNYFFHFLLLGPFLGVLGDGLEKIKEKRKDRPIRMQSSKEEQGEIRKRSSVINAKK